MIEISREVAQKFITNIQGLNEGNNCKNSLDVINKIHNLQIDTISVVARAQDITIFNRYKEYKEKDVWKWLKKKDVFEYWSHALCLLPIHSYSFYAWRMEYLKENNSLGWKKWLAENKSIVEKVYNHIKENGPTMSADFKDNEEITRSGWWDWKKEKIALEHLYQIGEIAITERKGFQKVYDLTERVIPSGINIEPMSKDEMPNFMVQTIFPALGIAGIDELKNYLGLDFAKYLWRSNKKAMSNFLDECVEQDIIIEIQVKDIDTKLYTHKTLENEFKKIESFSKDCSMKLLSPFDNIIRDRNYPLLLWNFEYKIDSYLPKDQRVFGYHVLPLLDNHSIVGRVDAKVHRKDKIMEFKSIYFEQNFKLNEESFQRFFSGLKEFSDFHRCDNIHFGEKIPKELKIKLEENN